MLTLKRLLEAHDAGELTRGELFAHMSAELLSIDLEELEHELRARDVLGAAIEWFSSVATGADVFTGGYSVYLSKEVRAAAARFLKRVRP